MNAPEILSFDDADARLDGALSNTFQGDYDTVLLFAGDVTLDGAFLDAVAALGGADADLVAVAGNLTVRGPIELYEGFPGLYVGGHTTADTLEGGDCEIYIQDGTFKYLVYGYYNDGILSAAGTVAVPWVINSDHHLAVEADGACWVDNYGDSNTADFDSKTIVDAFVSEVVNPEYYQLDVGTFLERLRAGLPVLREGAQTATAAAFAEVTAARERYAPVVDLSHRKARRFPAEVLAMPWLRELILDGNPIGALPEEIGTLANLEVLSVNKCGLTSLPASIGNLAKLRVLRVAGNLTYDFDQDPYLRPLALPDGLGQLPRLEELDVSDLSATPRSSQADPLPEATPLVLGSFPPRLRRLVADRTNLVFPLFPPGSTSLEELSMRGSSSVYLRRVPEAVASFERLRKLDLSGNFFGSLPADLSRLAELEELDLSGSLGLVTSPLPDLSAMPRLRVLGFSGNTSHSGVPVPPHDMLAQLFALHLPALEDLRIDRWGGEGKRGPLPAAVLAGIGAWSGLKRLDLSWNGLTDLPEDFFALSELEDVDLTRNSLRKRTRDRLLDTYPEDTIEL